MGKLRLRAAVSRLVVAAAAVGLPVITAGAAQAVTENPVVPVAAG